MEHRVDVLKPFGPRIFRAELPKDVFKKLLKITDDLIVDENRKNHGCNLAGQIQEEVEITKEMLDKHDLYKFFNSYLKSYVNHCLTELGEYDPEKHDLYTDLTSMWFNEMQPGGEYNPIHYHTGCHVSSVLYLKVPAKRPKRGIDCKEDRDGMIEFVDRAVLPDMLQRASTWANPKERIMYIWPSSLLHCVYHFLGDEVRRSIAWNGTYRVVNRERNTIVLGGTKLPTN